ncbi:hypothetical protein BDV11DRAFT_187522 [Aspergillus similis]
MGVVPEKRPGWTTVMTSSCATIAFKASTRFGNRVNQSARKTNARHHSLAKAGNCLLDNEQQRRTGGIQHLSLKTGQTKTTAARSIGSRLCPYSSLKATDEFRQASQRIATKWLGMSFAAEEGR